MKKRHFNTCQRKNVQVILKRNVSTNIFVKSKSISLKNFILLVNVHTIEHFFSTVSTSSIR